VDDIICAFTARRAWEEEKAALQSEVDGLRREAREKAAARRGAGQALQRHDDGAHCWKIDLQVTCDLTRVLCFVFKACCDLSIQ
jgi:hypothetical protein